MILNGLIESVEVQRSPVGGPIQSLETDLKITDVKEVQGNLEATFFYEVKYGQDIGFVRMAGRLLVSAPNKAAQDDVLAAWSKDKSTPLGFSQEVVNAAYNLCTINSVLATRIVNLSPPFPPMSIDLTKGLANAQKGAAPARPATPSTTKRKR